MPVKFRKVGEQQEPGQELLGIARVAGMLAYYRPGTSDEDVLKEVVCRRCYRKPTIGFDVFPSEHWLDLGANIGAFLVYCRWRGARVTAYEPDPGNYQLLETNRGPADQCFQQAVTALDTDQVTLYPGRGKNNHARYNIFGRVGGRNQKGILVGNTPIERLGDWHYDGIKMDIEGAELEILDNQVLPRCTKLVMEYHTSKDASSENLVRRVAFLQTRFRHVHYQPDLGSRMNGRKASSFHDRLIFCWGPV